MTRLLWIAVAYGNRNEVAQFVDGVAPIGGELYGWAICDNSAEPVPALNVSTSHVFVSRPDNPGYLEGALVCIDEWRARYGTLPEWVVLTNTDMKLVSGDPLDALKKFDPTVPIVLAPRITEGPTSIEKNPHVLVSRPRWRMRVNRWAAATTGLAWLYLVASRARLALNGRRRRRTVRNGRPSDADPATLMFAPYGAMIFFSRAFLELNAIPRNVPLMTEEYFIGEASRAAGAPVVYVPEIHAHHAAHQTTGAKVSWQRARAISRGFEAMANGLPR